MTDQSISRAAAIREATATLDELVELMNSDDMRPRLARENGNMGVQRAVHIVDELLKRLADLPGADLPEPPESADAARTFVIEHEAWYAEEIFARRNPRVAAAVSFTVDGSDSGWELTWEKIGDAGYAGIRLTVLDDAWEAFTLSGFDEIMSAVVLGQLDGHYPTVGEVVEAAKRNGWTDATVYEAPTYPREVAR
jgi:hypothetical protein